MGSISRNREEFEAGCVRTALQVERESFRSLTKIIQKGFSEEDSLDSSGNPLSDDVNFVPNDSFLEKDNVAQRICSLNRPPTITVMNMEFGKGGKVSPHRHDRTQTNYVLLGSYTDGVTGKVYKQGEVQVIASQQMHSMISDSCLLTTTWVPAFETTRIEYAPTLEYGNVVSFKSVFLHYYSVWKIKVLDLISKIKGIF